MKRTGLLAVICLALAALRPAGLAARTDRTDLPFADDPAALGAWTSVSFAEQADEFRPESGVMPRLFFAGVTLLPGGRTSNPDLGWTKGFIINPSMKTASKFTITAVNGIDYMLMEWKSGDYVDRDVPPGYYVMVRAAQLEKYKDRSVRKKTAAPAYDCMNPGAAPAICRRPAPSDYKNKPLAALPSYDPASGKLWQVDLRGLDISALDLSGRTTDLVFADFDTRTKFPARLPEGFDPARYLELGRDPGLGVRALHAKGITGKGIGIGIIDQPLLVTHKEYAGELRSYEEMHLLHKAPQATMHGGAVSSIAAGKTCGVAPDADLYYIATDFFDADGEINFAYLAAAIDRLIAISGALPKDRRIRAISISRGFGPGENGAGELLAAIDRARAKGILVVTTSTGNYYDFKFTGLGRSPLADPGAAASYGPGMFWSADFFAGRAKFAEGRLLVPMDSRTTAAPDGDDDYVFYSDGGMSWSAPYIAGLYALACQAGPQVTPEAFLKKAMETSVTVRVKKDGKELELKGIADPAALIK